MSIWKISIAMVLMGAPAAAAHADATSPLQAYRNVMREQYRAEEQPRPVRAEEAQHIYDNYLRSLGAPSKDSSNDAGDRSVIPQR